MVPGTRVAGRYTIEGELGRGGMGAVFVARDEKFQERVALKVAGASGVSADEFRGRFAREARLGNRLGKTPGLVRALDWGELDDGCLYLAMDLVSGARPLDLESGALVERLARFRSAARLVALVHSQGVVHRDLKPTNFLQAADGSLWLTDFGLAKVLGENESEPGKKDPGLTQTGTAMGTPTFMPPEQYDDASKADERSDVYALGVMLFSAITGGSLAYEGSAASIIQKHTRVRDGAAPSPRPSDRDPSVPQALDDLCVSAIAMDPAQRLESVATLVSGLELFLESSIGEVPTGPAVAAIERAARDDEGAKPTRARLETRGPGTVSLQENADVPTAPMAVVPSSSKTTPPEPASSAALVALAVLLALGLVATAVHVSSRKNAADESAEAPARVENGAPAVKNEVRPAAAKNEAPPRKEDARAPAKLPRGLREGTRVKLPWGGEARTYLWTLPASAGDLEMVYVPRGDFVMGADDASPEDGPRHVHAIARGYWIGRHETTWGDFLAFCRATGHKEPQRPTFWKSLEEPLRHPVTNVTWTDAIAYCKWAGLELPTESQWEKAARGIDGRTYPWGNEWDPKKANFLDSSCPETGKGKDTKASDGHPYTAPVGSFPDGASPFGALDMAGNVAEWCKDGYEARAYERYRKGDLSEPVLEDGSVVVRGGSWFRPARDCRAFARLKHGPTERFSALGFRPAKAED